MRSKGKYSVIRKIYAPIWIKGPIKKFVVNNTVTVGDAAGQAKPTTAGGIFSCGMGGIFAGNAISEYLKTNDKSKLSNYKIIQLSKLSILNHSLSGVSRWGHFLYF